MELRDRNISTIYVCIHILNCKNFITKILTFFILKHIIFADTIYCVSATIIAKEIYSLLESAENNGVVRT